MDCKTYLANTIERRNKEKISEKKCKVTWIKRKMETLGMWFRSGVDNNCRWNESGEVVAQLCLTLCNPM